MRLFGGMISATIKGNKENAINFIQRLKIFSLAESLGAVESLVEHPALMTHVNLGLDETLVRLSVGIEDVNDLIWDLEQALR